MADISTEELERIEREYHSGSDNIKPIQEFSKPEDLYDELIASIRKYHPSTDITLIEKAYHVAFEAHKGQVRKSGEAYIIHPLCVAIILAELELDKETIAAGLLHDVLEDTVMTEEQMREEFGDEVLLLVDGVTKLQHLHLTDNIKNPKDKNADRLEMQAENLRKMFLAMAKDIRVIMIKLADRPSPANSGREPIHIPCDIVIVAIGQDIVSDFYAIMGDLYHIKKMNVEAYAAYDSALVYKENNIGALNNYAYYLSVERKNLDKAEEMSYRTVKAEPTNGTYLDTYAWILFEKGKYVEAKIYIDQAMQNDGSKSSVVVEHCGDIYYMNGDREKALEYWQQAEKLSKEPPQEGSEERSEKELNLLRKKIVQKKYFAE